MTPAIRVKLPGHPPTSTSPSSPLLLKDEAKHEDTSQQNLFIPSTPRKNRSLHSSPATPPGNARSPSSSSSSRRCVRRYKHVIPPRTRPTSGYSTPPSPSPTKKTTASQCTTRVTARLSNSSGLLPSPTPSGKMKTPSATPRSNRKMKKAASDIPSPKRDLSSVKTFSLKEQKQIKLDPLVYEDPLLSSSSASPSTRNVTERERQDKIEKIEKFVSSVEKVKKKEETSSDENTKEEVGNLPEGFFDDSGCAFEWEGSSYSGRARTSSIESSFTSTTAPSTFDYSSSEGEFEGDKAVVHQSSSFEDVFFTPSSSSSSKECKAKFDTEESEESTTVSPASSVHSNSSHGSSSAFELSPPLGFEKDLLLGEFPSFNAVSLGENEIDLGSGEDYEHEHEEEEDDDFPLSMLERNLRGLIEEIPSSPTLTYSASFHQRDYHPSGQDNVTHRHQMQQRVEETRGSGLDRNRNGYQIQRFIGASPFPLPPPNVRNALESFESKFEISKKKSYPHLFPTSSSFASSPLPVGKAGLADRNIEAVNFGEDDEDRKRERYNSGPGYPLCRCGCGEVSSASSMSLAPFEADPSSVTSTSPSTMKLSNTHEGKLPRVSSKSTLHKSIWSMTSPLLSSAKEDPFSSRQASMPFNPTPKSDSFEIEQHALFMDPFGEGPSSATFMPSEEYYTPSSPSFCGGYNAGDLPPPCTPYGKHPSMLKRSVSSLLPGLTPSSSNASSPVSPLYPLPHHQYNHSFSLGPRHSMHPHHVHSHYPHPYRQQHHYSPRHPQGPSPNNKKGELYKTEMCRSWSEIGSCRYAEKCQFAHGLEELRQMPPFPSSSMSPSAPYSPAYSHQVNGPRSAIYSGAGRLQAHQVHHSIDYSPSPGRHLSNTTSKYHMHGMKSEEIAGHDDEFNYARRRSVSSPSKIRMYTTARTLGADWTGAETVHADEEYRIVENGSHEFSYKAIKQNSLFAALQAQAADAPAPSTLATRV